jgi:hypothetical protein
MRRELYGLVVAPALLLGGCISTAVAVVKAPFQVAGWTADKLTTSQSEADENRGRKERKLDEERAKQDRKDAKAARKAARGD